MHGPIDNKIYVQPLGFLRGSLASEAVKDGKARWLAGGPLGFALVKIIFQQSGMRVGEDFVPLTDLEGFLSDLAQFQQTEILFLMENISAPRGLLHISGSPGLLGPVGDWPGSNWKRPLIQGIVNVTPDSFSDGGKFNNSHQAISHAHRMIEAGVDLIDIGGESTRPGAEKISIAEELDRVLPVIEGLAGISVPLSIDTRNSAVMKAALKAGANIINDVSALTHDDQALDFVAGADCPVILMHAQNTPDKMQKNPEYDDVLLDVYDYLEDRIHICQATGIDPSRVIIDPGIGFGKSVDHNLQLVANLSLFQGLGVPVLLGVSRKQFIGSITGESNADNRLAGSLAAGQVGYDQGAQILRVHDVKETKQAVDVWTALSI